MERGGNSLHATLSVEQTDALLAEIPPTGLERYRPIRQLGSGGIAEVLLCEDQILKRELAIKRLKKPCQIDSVDERRFLREARIMAALPHPSIPVVYDLGRDRHGRPFFVTEVLRNGVYLVNVLSGLRRRVYETEFEYPLERLIRIMMLVCGAVEDAHNRGVIHRDIKPEHIYITGRNRVILLDWGLARLSSESRERTSTRYRADYNGCETSTHRLTSDGKLLGTPLYMSPEQVNDDPDLDHRTDIYSIGAVLYDCLVLDTLVSGGTVGEVFDRIVAGEVAKPTDVSRRSDLTADLERVCLKAVARVPSERYQTAGELGAALRDCQLNLLANFERDRQTSGSRSFGMPAGADESDSHGTTAGGPLQRRRKLRIGQSLEINKSPCLKPKQEKLLEPIGCQESGSRGRSAFPGARQQKRQLKRSKK